MLLLSQWTPKSKWVWHQTFVAINRGVVISGIHRGVVIDCINGIVVDSIDTGYVIRKRPARIDNGVIVLVNRLMLWLDDGGVLVVLRVIGLCGQELSHRHVLLLQLPHPIILIIHISPLPITLMMLTLLLIYLFSLLQMLIIRSFILMLFILLPRVVYWRLTIIIHIIHK